MTQSESNASGAPELFLDSTPVAPVLVALAQRREELSPEEFAEVAAYRVRIEQAKGMLMCAYGIDADNAFEVLTWWSQATNIKLRLLAVKLIDDFLALTPTEWLDPRSACDAMLFSGHELRGDTL
jgi:ANTAR domain